MYCTRKITDDIIYIGGSDRKLSLFEAVYPVPTGVSYNSYLVMDEKTVLFDTVDNSIGELFFENLAHELGGKPLDYIVVQHMEPDHSATLRRLLAAHPETKILCSAKALAMIGQFFEAPAAERVQVIKEGDTLTTGRHTFSFVAAPMVHWPEVMMTYDTTDKILFTADAFGTFGALDGAVFADEVDFMRDHLDEARRYYCNIVGKYGTQVQAVLKKAAGLDIQMICPLHGFVWRRETDSIIAKYDLWSKYEAEEKGVLIAYTSVYGGTQAAAELAAAKLRDKGINVKMYDASMTHTSYIVAEAFRFSHIIFATTTYNNGIFIKMEELLHDLTAHNFSNKTVAIIENGTWAPAAGKLIRAMLEPCKNITILDEQLTIKSAMKPADEAALDAMIEKIAADFVKPVPRQHDTAVDNSALFKISYGLYVLTANENGRDNGCIINTAQLLTDNPRRITVAVNKKNLTHDMMMSTGKFNISVLTDKAPFQTYKDFGFVSGRDKEKIADAPIEFARSENGVVYLTENVNAFISGKVIDSKDYGSHTLFTAEVTEARIIGEGDSVTYDIYQKHIKPKSAPTKKKGFICTVCGFIYEGEELPPDYECPLCGHGAADFEPLA
ncbi:MAG: flavin reductase [Ruminiclostridium sp.]|nr:flavin reductase [Ruminiclostridium sp.]